MMGHLLLLFVLATSVASTSAFSILVVSPLASPSHHLWIAPLVKELVRKGHRVHYAGLYSIDVEGKSSQNYTDTVFANLTTDAYMEDLSRPATWSEHSALYNTYFLYKVGKSMCTTAVASTAARELLEVVKNNEFDVIIQDISVGECFYGIWEVVRGNPRIIAYTPFGLIPSVKHISGGSHYSAIRPYTHGSIVPPFNLWQKICNVIYYAIDDIIRAYYYIPNMQSIAERYVRTRLPPLRELERKIDLILVNTYYAFEPGIPLPPNAVEVGGLPAQAHKELKDEKIKRFLDEATDGAVVVSLGTNVDWSGFGNTKLKIALTALSKLKQRVLWKLDTDIQSDVPANIMILKWIPQGDVMTHKNVKAAWTHCGLLSTHEAIWNGIPIIGMPVFMDQWPNAGLLVAKGVAVRLDLKTLTVESILDAFNKILYDPSYSRNMKTLSIQFRDRPIPPLDLAVWHVEYAAKNPGKMISWEGKNMNWMQWNLFDVYAVFLFILVCVVYICHRALKTLRSYLALVIVKIKIKKLKQV